MVRNATRIKKPVRGRDAAATTEPAGIELLLVGGLPSPKIPGEPEAGLFAPRTEGGDSKPLQKEHKQKVSPDTLNARKFRDMFLLPFWLSHAKNRVGIKLASGKR